MAQQFPPYEHTQVDAIPRIHSEIQSTFFTHKTKPVAYRLHQLRKLYWGLKDNEALITEACKKDIGKPAFETYVTETSWCLNDALFMCNNLEKWVKEEAAPDIPLQNYPLKARFRKDPLGCVLIIGTYNFPFQLTIGPLIGAIAAGCTAVIKPSESTPNCAAVMGMILRNYLDTSAYTCIQGAIPETTALLDQKWDKIFYTGSATVGKIISKKAAETLTPVTLELGGQNPAIVSRNADARLAARRLLWAKILNAGQVCISQNYIIVDKAIMPALVEEFGKALKEFYPNGAQCEDYARIVNLKQFHRLKKMLDSSTGKIIYGGTMDESDLYIEPTVVEVHDINDPLMTDESFGPFIPLFPVNDLDEAIDVANKLFDTPLGCYPFGNKAEVDQVLSQTRSGGVSINDGFFHGCIPTLAFGGVGESGQGSYRGKASFDCFTHKRPVTQTPSWMESLLSVRYPPYKGKMARFKAMTEMKPNFDRDGNVVGWIGWLMGKPGSSGAPDQGAGETKGLE